MVYYQNKNEILLIAIGCAPFACHCFKCGNSGHFVVECQKTPILGQNTPLNDMPLLNRWDKKKHA